MNLSRRRWLGIAFLFAGAVVALACLRTAPTSAHQPAAAGVSVADLAHAIQTQVVTLKVQEGKGEPRVTSATASFDRRVLSYWISVVGADVKFIRTTEHQINRALFNVDPYARIINGKEVEVSGKLGIRDGSGNWDDPYEGTITVAVTALLDR
jgi:hypothetical protein